MLRKIINQCDVSITLEALEPILVASEASVVHGVEMPFVRTNREGNLEPYLPGSSLKGVLRSHAERIARTLNEKRVCGVFEEAPVPGCSQRLDSAEGPSDYARSCPACKLFGSLHWKGRFTIGDAYLAPEYRDVKPERRDCIGIDRISGGVASGVNFDLEVLPAGTQFTTQLSVINFETWQLGWLAYVLRDLMEGHIRIGKNTSRGLGRVQGRLPSLSVQYVGEPEELGTSLPGIGMLLSKDEQTAYGLQADDVVDLPAAVTFERPAGSLRSRTELTDPEIQHSLLAALAPAWDTYIQHAPSLVN